MESDLAVVVCQVGIPRSATLWTRSSTAPKHLTTLATKLHRAAAVQAAAAAPLSNVHVDDSVWSPHYLPMIWFRVAPLFLILPAVTCAPTSAGTYKRRGKK